MPWFILHPLTEDDAHAIAAYLKTMPPVSHFVPAPLEYGFVETLIGKLTTPLPPAMPRVLTYADGDFADPSVPSRSRDWPSHALKTAEWIVLGLGFFAFVFAGPAPRRRGRAVLIGVAVAVLALLAWVIVQLPQIIPPEPLVQGLFASSPHLDVSRLPAPQAAMAERGAYLYKTTSCFFCHLGDGSGGTKISWKPFGSLYVRNISSDGETGIGDWSDAEVARAIRSGVSRHGRQLHWQGMIWDLLSNLDEEDVRSLIVYLRTLPPVRKAVPSPRFAPDDCDVYSFFLRGSAEPGCR
jgi:cytochrome c553